MVYFQKPKINIICVTRNVANYLDRCLESIAKQSYTNISVIIQDGQSTDGTIEIIKKWESVVEYWESVPDQGIYDAMNKALRHVTGDFVYFIGADDYLYPEFSEMIELYVKKPDTVYYANVLNGGHKHDGEFSSYKLSHTTINHQAIIYPASAFKKYKYDTKYKICADHLLNMQLYGDKAYRFQYVNKLIAFFSRDGISSSGVQDLVFKKDQKQYVKQNFSLWVYLRYLNRMSKKHRRLE